MYTFNYYCILVLLVTAGGVILSPYLKTPIKSKNTKTSECFQQNISLNITLYCYSKYLVGLS